MFIIKEVINELAQAYKKGVELTIYYSLFKGSGLPNQQNTVKPTPEGCGRYDLLLFVDLELSRFLNKKNKS